VIQCLPLIPKLRSNRVLREGVKPSPTKEPRDNVVEAGFIPAHLLRVRELMTHSVSTIEEHATLSEVMEALCDQHFGAMLITWRGHPAGVVSKTDLILAYRHGVSVTDVTRLIMRTPVRSCDENDELVRVIRQMIFYDIKRFFVYKGDPDEILGVISLTDAAQARSGSCRACMTSRIEVL
jgi:CBS domain-containing protein